MIALVTKEPAGWLAGKRDDPEFQRLCAREDLIEDFLSHMELEMKRRRISRVELARRMKCTPSKIAQMFARSCDLTVTAMIDVAFHLNVRMRLIFDDRAISQTGAVGRTRVQQANPRVKEPQHGAELVTCGYCDRGFRRVNGIHIGSQRLGMIPNSPCDRVFAARDGAMWLAHVDGDVLRTQRGMLRRFATAKTAGAAARAAAPKKWHL